jgi:steroid delta-isomerase-like uncharacterized protein
MSADLTRFCNQWLAAWTGNQPEKLISFYSEDAFYSDPANSGGLRGHSEILPYFQKLLAKNPDWIWKALEIIPTEKGFTLKWRAAVPVKEKTLQLVGLDIVELRDGKIMRNEVYFDPTSLRG